MLRRARSQTGSRIEDNCFNSISLFPQPSCETTLGQLISYSKEGLYSLPVEVAEFEISEYKLATSNIYLGRTKVENASIQSDDQAQALVDEHRNQPIHRFSQNSSNVFSQTNHACTQSNLGDSQPIFGCSQLYHEPNRNYSQPDSHCSQPDSRCSHLHLNQTKPFTVQFCSYIFYCFKPDNTSVKLSTCINTEYRNPRSRTCIRRSPWNLLLLLSIFLIHSCSVAAANPGPQGKHNIFKFPSFTYFILDILKEMLK